MSNLTSEAVIQILDAYLISMSHDSATSSATMDGATLSAVCQIYNKKHRFRARDLKDLAEQMRVREVEEINRRMPTHQEPVPAKGQRRIAEPTRDAVANAAAHDTEIAWFTMGQDHKFHFPFADGHVDLVDRNLIIQISCLASCGYTPRDFMVDWFGLTWSMEYLTCPDLCHFPRGVLALTPHMLPQEPTTPEN